MVERAVSELERYLLQDTEIGHLGISHQRSLQSLQNLGEKDAKHFRTSTERFLKRNTTTTTTTATNNNNNNNNNTSSSLPSATTIIPGSLTPTSPREKKDGLATTISTSSLGQYHALSPRQQRKLGQKSPRSSGSVPVRYPIDTITSIQSLPEHIFGFDQEITSSSMDIDNNHDDKARKQLKIERDNNSSLKSKYDRQVLGETVVITPKFLRHLEAEAMAFARGGKDYYHLQLDDHEILNSDKKIVMNQTLHDFPNNVRVGQREGLEVSRKLLSSWKDLRLLVGYDNGVISTSPKALSFWDYSLLQPYSGPKCVKYAVLYPDLYGVKNCVRNFFQELGSYYELCGLGSHTPIQIQTATSATTTTHNNNNNNNSNATTTTTTTTSASASVASATTSSATTNEQSTNTLNNSFVSYPCYITCSMSQKEIQQAWPIMIDMIAFKFNSLIQGIQLHSNEDRSTLRRGSVDSLSGLTSSSKKKDSINGVMIYIVIPINSNKWMIPLLSRILSHAKLERHQLTIQFIKEEHVISHINRRLEFQSYCSEIYFKTPFSSTDSLQFVQAADHESSSQENRNLDGLHICESMIMIDHFSNSTTNTAAAAATTTTTLSSGSDTEMQQHDLNNLCQNNLHIAMCLSACGGWLCLAWTDSSGDALYSRAYSCLASHSSLIERKIELCNILGAVFDQSKVIAQHHSNVILSELFIISIPGYDVNNLLEEALELSMTDQQHKKQQIYLTAWRVLGGVENGIHRIVNDLLPSQVRTLHIDQDCIMNQLCKLVFLSQGPFLTRPVKTRKLKRNEGDHEVLTYTSFDAIHLLACKYLSKLLTNL